MYYPLPDSKVSRFKHCLSGSEVESILSENILLVSMDNMIEAAQKLFAEIYAYLSFPENRSFDPDRGTPFDWYPCYRDFTVIAARLRKPDVTKAYYCAFVRYGKQENFTIRFLMFCLDDQLRLCSYWKERCIGMFEYSKD